MHDSLWLENVTIPTYPTLDHDLEVDVCIVGAGITGITLAYLLKDTDLKVALIDSNQLLHGATAYTTAKITIQHGLIYHHLIQTYGKDIALNYATSQQEALNFITQTIHDLKIDCDLESKFSAIYTQLNKNVSLFEKEFKAYQELGLNGSLVDELDLPFPIEKALVLNEQAEFHPLKYLTPLLEAMAPYSNIEIYEQTTAIDVNHQQQVATVITDTSFKIQAQQIVQASHVPFYDDLSFMFTKMEATRSYLITCQDASPLPSGMYLSYEHPIRSIRTFKDWLLIGGESHRTGDPIDTTKCYEALFEFAHDYFHPSKIPFSWSTQDYETIDQLPFIGRLHQHSPILVASGFRKWGMTTGTCAALLLRDLILHQDNPYIHLYSPCRHRIPKGIKNFLTYNSKVAYEYLKGKLSLTEVKNNEVYTIKTDDGKFGIYIDEQQEPHVIDLTCPHLGCELTFNEAEKTWDCPCHGSRFSLTGEVMAGPAHSPLTSTKNHIDPNLR